MNTYKNKKVLVAGLAKSGMSAIELLHRCGAVITATEKRSLDQIKELDYLHSLGVEVLPQTMEVFEGDYDLVVKNPAVPPVSKEVQRLKERGIPVITEIELAYTLAKPQHYCAITGTNGKTTTTQLTYEILHAFYGDKALVGGNIGTPLCQLVLDHDLLHNEGNYISLEISNHQLVDIDTFRPEASVILNLTPDHIATMGSLENYYRSKTLIYKNAGEEDIFLYNLDDPLIEEYTEKHPFRAKKVTFSLEKEADGCLKGEKLYLYGEELMPVSEVRIVGKHNLQNILVSSLLAYHMGVDRKTIRETVAAFQGVEHRIEFVRELDGVRYYNDSKATNTDATITALKAFDPNVILLVGGSDKGLSMDDVRKNMKCVKQVIGFGAAGKRLAADLDPSAPVVKDLSEAVKLAHELSVPGDTVLLSPTTASFDQYSGYEERGRHFKKLVSEL